MTTDDIVYVLYGVYIRPKKQLTVQSVDIFCFLLRIMVLSLALIFAKKSFLYRVFTGTLKNGWLHTSYVDVT
jgi:hypothetical protein